MIRGTLAIAVGAGLAFAGLAGAAEYRAGDVVVSGIWARATPPGATNGAVYLSLEVKSDRADRLIGATSAAAARVELHKSREEAGIMRMIPIGEIEIRPRAPAVLAPGGVHLMLVGVTRPLVKDETLPLTLTFARGGAVAVTVPILGLAATGPILDRPDDPHAGH